MSVLRSIGAILAGLVTIFVLSMGIDHVLHVTNVYPPYGEPMHDPALNALALAYRIPIAIFGCWLTARLAPRAPMTHALILGAIGLVLSSLGAMAAIQMNLGPIWYPVALAASALPSAWLGAKLHKRG